MKKFFTILAVLLFAAGAFAQDAPKEEKKGPEFTYGLDAFVFGWTGSQADYKYDAAHLRVRPLFTISDENVKGVVRLEIDQDFGRESSDSGADPGTDNKVVEVKWAYIQMNDLLIPKLNITAGLAGYKYPFVVDNDFSLAKAEYDFGFGKASLAFIKINEYDQDTVAADKTSKRNDVDSYAVDIPLKFKLGEKDFIQIRPGFMYFKGGNNSDNVGSTALYDRLNAYNAAINLSGSISALSFELTGASLSGEYKYGDETTGVTKYDLKSYVADAIVSVKPVDMIKISIFATVYSGDDDSTDKEENDYAQTMKDINGYGTSFGRAFLLTGMSSPAQWGGQSTGPFDQTFNSLGIVMYGISAEIKPSDKISLLAQYTYAALAEDNTSGDNAIGSEIDGRISYNVASKTSIFLEGGYFMASDVTGVGPDSAADAENGYEIAFGVKSTL